MLAAAPTRKNFEPTPLENLQSLSEKPITLNSNSSIKFSYVPKHAGGGDTFTIKVINENAKQEYSVTVSDAAEKAQQILSKCHRTRNLLTQEIPAGNDILLTAYREEAVAAKLGEFKTEFGAVATAVGLAHEKNLDDRVLAVLGISEKDRAGFSSCIRQPESDLGMLHDIKRGNQQILFTKGEVTLQLRIGKRVEIFVEVPGGLPRKLQVGEGKTDQPLQNSTRARFGVMLDPKADPEEIVSNIKDILAAAKDIKDADSLVGSASSEYPEGSLLLHKMIELGKISRIEHLNAKNVQWSQTKCGDRLLIRNVRLENSRVEFAGAFYAEDFETCGATHLMLNSAGSVLHDCVLGRGTVVTGYPSKTSDKGHVIVPGGLLGAVLVGKTELHCNAYHCDLRGLVIVDGKLSKLRPAAWENFKGLVYDQNQITDSILVHGHPMSKGELASELEKMDRTLTGATLKDAIIALCPGCKIHSEEGPKASADGGASYYFYSITTKDQDRFLEISVPVDYDSSNRYLDPKNRLSMRFDSPAEARTAQASFLNAQSALHTALLWLRWTKNTVDEQNEVHAGMVSSNTRDEAVATSVEKDIGSKNPTRKGKTKSFGPGNTKTSYKPGGSKNDDRREQGESPDADTES